jgi:hypothetical protein
MVYLLTPTGGRPEGLALLGEYLDAQTYDGPATWVIVDDCDPQTPLPVTRHVTQVIRPPWRWKDGENTQARSILAGVEVIPDDAVLFVVEDDDCYLPEYIETMLKALESADLVGESTARYYNVRTGKYKIMNTPHHSSLASTAMRGTAALAAACKARPKFIDVTLWRSFKGRKAWVKAQNVVGIKGLPGRAGIGVGHRDRFGSPDMSNVLEQWTGDYACNYRGYAR